jgi:membrane protein implicated in regulation of membrane protease activity
MRRLALHAPNHRLLGMFGIAALVAGIAVAVLDVFGSFVLALLIATPFALAAVALVAVAVHKARAASHRRVDCGAEGLIGRVGVVRDPLDPLGRVAVDGELWRARRSWAEEDEPPPGEGDQVVVDRVHGLTLSVRRAEVWEVER